MFRSVITSPINVTGFPRIRGDVPHFGGRLVGGGKFSPHTRGCSDPHRVGAPSHWVFPAYAGMFRPQSGKPHPPSGFPRIRGDVPETIQGGDATRPFSPHTRGCSLAAFLNGLAQEVFPAYAGMFRRDSVGLVTLGCFPRIRGDVPHLKGLHGPRGRFSPHTRGCSFGYRPTSVPRPVFPAYAGMFLSSVTYGSSSRCFPRIRGDVPDEYFTIPPQSVFSPHTRGCSAAHPLTLPRFVVFPAYAGMFLRVRRGRGTTRGFPRIRGDVPLRMHFSNTLPWFSPHTRGCSGHWGLGHGRG